MPKPFLLVIGCLLTAWGLASCGQAPAGNETTAEQAATEVPPPSPGYGHFTEAGDSLLLPPFEIAVALSPKAEAKLAADRETVIVSASFSGARSQENLDNFDIMEALEAQGLDVELRQERVAKFAGLKIAKTLYDSLGEKDLMVLVNVYSGRRSSENNLLSCGIVQDRLAKLQGQRHTITGKLIYGDE